MKKLSVATVVLLAMSVVPVLGQDVDREARAEAGKSPSEILSTIESRDDFRFLEGMSWNEEGYYEIVYRTGDSARVEINIDAVTGEPIAPE